MRNEVHSGGKVCEQQRQRDCQDAAFESRTAHRRGRATRDNRGHAAARACYKCAPRRPKKKRHPTLMQTLSCSLTSGAGAVYFRLSQVRGACGFGACSGSVLLRWVASQSAASKAMMMRWWFLLFDKFLCRA